RVRVLEAGGTEQCAALFEQFDDDQVGFEDGQIFIRKPRSTTVHIGVALLAGVVDVLDLGQIVALAGVKVIDAVGGGCVHSSGALFGGDIVGGDAQNLPVEEGV